VCRAGRPLAQRPVWTVAAGALWRFGCPIHPASGKGCSQKKFAPIKVQLVMTPEDLEKATPALEEAARKYG
jgi:hypothetical protein